MMKKPFSIALGLSLAVAASGAFAQASSQADQQFFNQHIGDLVTLKPTSLDNPALAKVLSGQFYNVDVMVTGVGTKVLVARAGSSLVQVTMPSTTEDMPGFKQLIKPEFRLKSDEDAHSLQDAIDILYPISSGFGDEDAHAKTIKHVGNTWTFVRGKFFDHFKGFVFTTDADGVITNVKYLLDIE